jgi:hypothetical protein
MDKPSVKAECKSYASTLREASKGGNQNRYLTISSAVDQTRVQFVLDFDGNNIEACYFGEKAPTWMSWPAET